MLLTFHPTAPCHPPAHEAPFFLVQLLFSCNDKLEFVEENTSSGATRHLPLKGKAFGTFFLAFPFGEGVSILRC